MLSTLMQYLMFQKEQKHKKKNRTENHNIVTDNQYYEHKQKSSSNDFSPFFVVQPHTALSLVYANFSSSFLQFLFSLNLMEKKNIHIWRVFMVKCVSMKSSWLGTYELKHTQIRKHACRNQEKAKLSNCYLYTQRIELNFELASIWRVYNLYGQMSVFTYLCLFWDYLCCFSYTRLDLLDVTKCLLFFYWLQWWTVLV